MQSLSERLRAQIEQDEAQIQTYTNAILQLQGCVAAYKTTLRTIEEIQGVAEAGEGQPETDLVASEVAEPSADPQGEAGFEGAATTPEVLDANDAVLYP